MPEPTRIIFDLGGEVRISPPLWPDRPLDVQPGDLSQFAPYGSGVYGLQAPDRNNPFTSAPPQEANAGVVYFGNDVTREDLGALMRVVGGRFGQPKPPQDFAVFCEESKDPGQDGYMNQMRIVPRFALRHLFNAITDAEYTNFPKQEVSVVDAFWRFMEVERGRWGTSFGSNRGLEGLFGGDGHFARECLSFGLMMENSYFGVCRIWSRAWLVTK